MESPAAIMSRPAHAVAPRAMPEATARRAVRTPAAPAARPGPG